ncbi:MAG: glycosyltransferase family 4 protein [Alphaproteobacteria bacterium]|nr:glycosyltransferase family 4 protein [Alphaproteobacteria bacterium]
MKRPEFRAEMVRRVCNNFDPATTIIETPELGAVSLVLPDEYKVHVRMHCPAAIVEHYQGRAINTEKFKDQLRAIHSAHVTSSPSYGLLDELALGAKAERIHVYKNPLPVEVRHTAAEEKSLDLVFIARFDRAKGTDFLDAVLERLPADFRAVLIGRDAEEFRPSPRIRCALEVHEHRDGPDRLRFLERARVSLILSRFENCPMLILESLMAGTPVVAWDVGGISEMAPPPVLKIAPLGDIPALTEMVIATARGENPVKSAFECATRHVADDFREGLARIIESCTENTSLATFRGMTCRQHHAMPPTKSSQASVAALLA